VRNPGAVTITISDNVMYLAVVLIFAAIIIIALSMSD
jgi:hypothetical protein